MVELGELEEHYYDFAQRGTRLMVVSLEGTEEAEKTKSDFPHLLVAADNKRGLARVVDVIQPDSAPDGSDTAAPTTILIDRKGIVRWLFRPGWYIERLSPKELLDAVDKYLTTD
jgi:peroxiredoxin